MGGGAFWRIFLNGRRRLLTLTTAIRNGSESDKANRGGIKVVLILAIAGRRRRCAEEKENRAGPHTRSRWSARVATAMSNEPVYFIRCRHILYTISQSFLRKERPRKCHRYNGQGTKETERSTHSVYRVKCRLSVRGARPSGGQCKQQTYSIHFRNGAVCESSNR